LDKGDLAVVIGCNDTYMPDHPYVSVDAREQDEIVRLGPAERHFFALIGKLTEDRGTFIWSSSEPGEPSVRALVLPFP